MGNISRKIKDLLSEDVPVAVLTGAGISAESGVPTFRGQDGFWKQHRAEDLATVNAFMADPELRAAAVSAVRNFCRCTRIDLAGFDLLFSEGAASSIPFFLEINYFFGRRGIGGSEAYYRILDQEIDSWLRRNGLAAMRADC